MPFRGLNKFVMFGMVQIPGMFSNTIYNHSSVLLLMQKFKLILFPLEENHIIISSSRLKHLLCKGWEITFKIYLIYILLKAYSFIILIQTDEYYLFNIVILDSTA